jgi:uncharacterized membrane protein
MIPFVPFLVATLLARLAGALGVDALDCTSGALRAGFVVLFLLTASAHFGSRRSSLIRMVPPSLPNAALLVTVTGILELMGAVLLMVPSAAPFAAAVLIAMLLAMFPANVHAARTRVSIGTQRATPLGVRSVMQVVYILGLVGTMA